METDYELKAGTRIDGLLNDHILYTDGGRDVCGLAEHDAALIHEELRAIEQERDALREALEDCIRGWLALHDMANGPVYRDMLSAADAVLIKVVDWYAEHYPDAPPIRQRHLEAHRD